MTGREFFAVASDLLKVHSEAHWRSAAGRAYYGLFLECREALARWGIVAPPRYQVHFFVKSRFSGSNDKDLQYIGRLLDRTGHLRNQADYELVSRGFQSAGPAANAFQDARAALLRLDQIEANPQRRAQAIAAVKAVP